MLKLFLYPCPTAIRLGFDCRLVLAALSLYEANAEERPIDGPRPVTQKHKESDEGDVIAADSIVGIREVNARYGVVVSRSEKRGLA